jgi:hypothetical protein
VNNPLYLPPKNIRSTADFGNWSAITLTGPSHVSFTDGSTTGNQASTNGAYLLIGSFSTNSGSIVFGSPTNGWLRWSPRIMNMTWALPAQVGGTVLCLTNMTGAILDQVAVRTTNATVNVIQPWTNSVGIDLPNKDSGNEILIGSLKISGFSDGIPNWRACNNRLYEHHGLQQCRCFQRQQHSEQHQSDNSPGLPNRRERERLHGLFRY